MVPGIYISLALLFANLTFQLLTLVGFVICLSLLGILYGNLSTITEERDSILVKKNEIKQEVGGKIASPALSNFHSNEKYKYENHIKFISCLTG